jgi:hypothetical protein
MQVSQTCSAVKHALKLLTYGGYSGILFTRHPEAVPLASFAMSNPKMFIPSPCIGVTRKDEETLTRNIIRPFRNTYDGGS